MQTDDKKQQAAPADENVAAKNEPGPTSAPTGEDTKAEAPTREEKAADAE